MSRRITTFLILISSLMFSAFVCKKEIVPESKFETRGVWVTRFDYTTNIDSTDSDSQKAAISKYLNIAKESNLNTVFFQVRGSFDAYYKSSYEPWAKALSGSLGVDPGWDPLEFAIKKAKENGYERCTVAFHLTTHDDQDELVLQGKTKDESEQLRQLARGVYLDPALPEPPPGICKQSLELVEPLNSFWISGLPYAKRTDSHLHGGAERLYRIIHGLNKPVHVGSPPVGSATLVARCFPRLVIRKGDILAG